MKKHLIPAILLASVLASSLLAGCGAFGNQTPEALPTVVLGIMPRRTRPPMHPAGQIQPAHPAV